MAKRNTKPATVAEPTTDDARMVDVRVNANGRRVRRTMPFIGRTGRGDIMLAAPDGVPVAFDPATGCRVIMVGRKRTTDETLVITDGALARINAGDIPCGPEPIAPVSPTSVSGGRRRGATTTTPEPTTTTATTRNRRGGTVAPATATTGRNAAANASNGDRINAARAAGNDRLADLLAEFAGARVPNDPGTNGARRFNVTVNVWDTFMTHAKRPANRKTGWCRAWIAGVFRGYVYVMFTETDAREFVAHVASVWDDMSPRDRKPLGRTCHDIRDRFPRVKIPRALLDGTVGTGNARRGVTPEPTPEPTTTGRRRKPPVAEPTPEPTSVSGGRRVRRGDR